MTVSSAGWEAFSLSSEDRSTNSHHLTFSTSLIGRRGIPSATTIEGAGVLGSTSDVPALLSRDGSEGMDGTSSGLIGNDGQDSRAAPAKGIHTRELLPWYSGPVGPCRYTNEPFSGQWLLRLLTGSDSCSQILFVSFAK